MGGEHDSLPALLRTWRKRTKVREIQGLTASGRRAECLTQRDVARLVGVSERWYGAFERGVEAAYSPVFLNRLSSLFRLSPAERQTLYLKVLGHPPAPTGSVSAGAVSEIDVQLLQQFLDNQDPAPAFATDLAWNVIAYNGALLHWFPWVSVEVNQMRWILLAPEARYQLVSWRRDWARPLLGRIRYERAHHPNNEVLIRLERDVLAGSTDVREMWELREVADSSPGRLRRLRLPCHRGREVAVRIVAMRLMYGESLYVNVLLPDPAGDEDVI
ncbi:helix-turn-helix domain-containing protein [Streptomyces sp. NPDC057509]|uniref:helix-turn-helix domain-containing protein n=1 Tax=Streptomyces sp. NPDC057509 TaxID=3346152 RepID=UPI003692F005